tara:strand:+ start:2119 stop:2571 length:453 start_codon:yes stop_codon:yes gene_type:complete
MKKTSKIGWQKYEDVLESQLNSPVIDQLYSSLFRKSQEIAIEDLSEEELEEMERIMEEEGFGIQNNEQMINISESLASEISLATNFECWIGHTNFNLTENIKDKLDQIEGVEMLKVYSRYRFLVGIGRMFDFSDVRKNIESIFNKDSTKE